MHSIGRLIRVRSWCGRTTVNGGRKWPSSAPGQVSQSSALLVPFSDLYNGVRGILFTISLMGCRVLMLKRTAFLFVWILGGCTSSSQYLHAGLEDVPKGELAMIVGGYKEYGSRPDLTTLIFEIDGIRLVEGYKGSPRDVYVRPGRHSIKYWANVPKDESSSGAPRQLIISDEVYITLINASTFPYDRQLRTCLLTFEAGKRYGKRDLENALSAAGCPVIED